jgi:hypothetical protein
MSQATVFSELHFDSITFNDLLDGVKPHFQCPICHFAWQPKLTLTTTAQATFEYNQKADFTIPTHTNLSGQQCAASNQIIELFIAAHKDSQGTVLCIQRSNAEGTKGINANWWNKSDSAV